MKRPLALSLVLMAWGSTAHAITWDQAYEWLKAFQDLRSVNLSQTKSRYLDDPSTLLSGVIGGFNGAPVATFDLSFEKLDALIKDPLNVTPERLQEWRGIVTGDYNKLYKSILDQGGTSVPTNTGEIKFKGPIQAATASMLRQQAQNYQKSGESELNTAKSSELTRKLNEDEEPKQLVEAVTGEGGTADTLEDRMREAVSTRAAIQSYGEGFADYMRQTAVSHDQVVARLNAMLSQATYTNEQLKTLVQQAVQESAAEADAAMQEYYADVESTRGEAKGVEAMGNNLAGYLRGVKPATWDGMYTALK